MKHRDQLLVLVVLSLTGSAALLSLRGSASVPAALTAVLSLLALCIGLVAWARWLYFGSPSLQGRALVLNGAASLLVATLWLEFVLSIQPAIDPPLRWLLSLALAWMLTPFSAVALTRLARRIGPQSR